MKALKKIVKILAIVGAIAGIAKVVMRVLNLTKRMNDYNEKTVCGGKIINYEEEPFEKDSVAGLCSGLDLNFKHAKMLNAVSQLDILGRFSGISVKVPEHWHVEMDGTAVQSGISKRFADNSEVEDAPKLQINYDIKYCGLDVSNPAEEDLVDAIEGNDEIEDEIVIEDVVEETSEMSEETKKVIEEFEENFSNDEEPISEDDESNSDEDTL